MIRTQAYQIADTTNGTANDGVSVDSPEEIFCGIVAPAVATNALTVQAKFGSTWSNIYDRRLGTPAALAVTANVGYIPFDQDLMRGVETIRVVSADAEAADRDFTIVSRR
jgi:hypothetical protein